MFFLMLTFQALVSRAPTYQRSASDWSRWPPSEAPHNPTKPVTAASEKPHPAPPADSSGTCQKGVPRDSLFPPHLPLSSYLPSIFSLIVEVHDLGDVVSLNQPPPSPFTVSDAICQCGPRSANTSSKPAEK